VQGRHGRLSSGQKHLAFRQRAQGWRSVDMVGIMVRSVRHTDAKPFRWEPLESAGVSP
jgi:hypothetical protein